MLRLSLAVTLMLTQTWQAFAAPVYFCVAPDGAQGVDLGPETCACRYAVELVAVATPADLTPAETGSCATRGCCGGHDRDASESIAEVEPLVEAGQVDSSALVPADCLCKHVPVSCTSPQVVSKLRTLLPASTMSHAGCLLVKSVSLVTGSADWGLRPPLDDSGGTLRALKSIVLRC